MKKYILFSVVFILTFILILININYVSKQESGLPYNIKSNNVALLFTMTNENGRKENLDMMSGIFKDKKLGFSSEVYHNKTSKQIYNRLSEVSKKIEDDSTLLIYLNSHGGGSGKNFIMSAADENFKFSKALAAISSNKKIKRIIFLVDTCHAEGSIQEGFDGGGKMIKNSKVNLPELPDKCDKKFFLFDIFEKNKEIYYGKNSEAYQELLIVASSSVRDLSIRGAFAKRLQKAFEYAKDKDEITVLEFLQYFAELHKDTTQQPHYKAIPEGLLKEPLFYNIPARDIPVKDRQNKNFNKDQILIPN